MFLRCSLLLRVCALYPFIYFTLWFLKRTYFKGKLTMKLYLNVFYHDLNMQFSLRYPVSSVGKNVSYIFFTTSKPVLLGLIICTPIRLTLMTSFKRISGTTSYILWHLFLFILVGFHYFLIIVVIFTNAILISSHNFRVEITFKKVSPKTTLSSLHSPI